LYGDAAHAYHADMRSPEAGQGRVAIQARNAAEAAVKVDLIGGGSRDFQSEWFHAAILADGKRWFALK
jgi:hypothetical protein